MIYADNAATTKMSRTAIEAMLPYMDKIYGNPSSLYSFGQDAKEALEGARERIAAVLGCEPREITFTSGGSEADNQAIFSAARQGEKKGKKHIISTAFEHHAVLHTLEKLKKQGFEITLLDVHKNGIVTPEQVADAIREDTCLVTMPRNRHVRKQRDRYDPADRGDRKDLQGEAGPFPYGRSTGSRPLICKC